MEIAITFIVYEFFTTGGLLVIVNAIAIMPGRES